MLTEIIKTLKARAFDHLQSREFLVDQKQRNFERTLSVMSDYQKDFWFDGKVVKTLDDLNNISLKTSKDILQTQIDKPPFGALPSGEIMFTSSGSSGGRKPVFHYSWNDYLNMWWANSRWIGSWNVGPQDTVMTLDVGTTQAGYRRFEDISSFVFGARMMKSGGTTWVQKLERMRDHNITILIGNTEKLKRLAAHNPKKYLRPGQLRMIGQMGMALTDEEYLCDAFGIDQITDLYGSAEMGSVHFECPHGQLHFHDDLVHSVDHSEGTLLSNLYSIPIFNYLQAPGEYVKYSYKGVCACGSYLPTVDNFVPRKVVNPNFVKE